jgi:hypothetical protein
VDGGYLTSLADIEGVSLGASDWRDADPRARRRPSPARARHPARLGGARRQRRGRRGIVVKRFGENALKVIQSVKDKLQEVQHSMPPGITIVPTYDRSWLISESINSLRHTLIEESIVVSIVIIIFLVHFPTALIPILALPITVLASRIPMYYLDVTSNIMSLGGLALAIGVWSAHSIVMVENAYGTSRRGSETVGDAPHTAGPAAAHAWCRTMSNHRSSCERRSRPRDRSESIAKPSQRYGLMIGDVEAAICGQKITSGP